MTEKLYSQVELRNFLLGDLPEAARSVIEDRFLADENFATELCVLEDELIEAYLRNDLSAHDRQQFESAFLADPRRRERVVALKAMLAVADVEGQDTRAQPGSFWSRLGSALRLQTRVARLAWATAALAFMMFGVWVIYRSIGGSEPAHLSRTTNTGGSFTNAVPTPEPSVRQNSSPTTLASPTARQSVTPTPATAGPTVATITLRPSLVRDPQAASKLILTPSVSVVRLQFELEHDDYDAYFVRLTTVEGRVVWKGGPVRPVTIRANRTLILSIPASRLTPQDYLVEVSGVRGNSAPENLSGYFFIVRSN